jgi:hypothetical protein
MRFLTNFTLSILFFGIISCQFSWDSKEVTITPNVNDSLSYVITGYSNDVRLKEVSGMVKSLRFPGHFWVHNDSGDNPVIFRVNDSLQIIQEVVLIGAQNIDWEDAAISEYMGEPVLFIGDIGDNLAVRNSVSIYLIKEPLSDQTSMEVNRKIELEYEDGSRDAEMLLFDSITSEILIVTKRDIPSRVYSFPINSSENKGILIFEGHLKLSDNSTLEPNEIYRITGGDSSTKGEVILKNYHSVYYYSPNSGLNIKDRLIADSPVKIEYQRELQGEAIALDQNGYWVTSECADDGKNHIPQPLYFYRGFKTIE